jgi:hypothetical protein
MSRRRWVIVAALWAGVVVGPGCNIHRKRGPAGTIYQQRNEAVVHDPFPNHSAGPTIEGGRPLGYQKPLSEPARIQSSPYAQRGLYGGF